jgi:hypothetical protein
VAAASVLVDRVAPLRGSLSSTVTRARSARVTAAPPAPLGADSIQTRTWTWRGFGQSMPKNLMTAPASPPPLNPLVSAMVASPPDRLPPGRIAGARTSIAASRKPTSAASSS